MVAVGEGDFGDYVDETVKYIPPTPLENTMNDIEPDRLLKYLDPEFINATPNKDDLDPSRLEIEEKERMGNMDFEHSEAELAELQEEAQKAAMLAPREYQYELYQKALQENVLAVLDTGTGKTLISVILIKEMVQREREARLTRRETKLAFFLVERVPLVFQQANVIVSNLDVNLEKMCGEMDVDNWSEKKWKLIFEENDVCVMTAQIFLDCLNHGFISLEKVHLLIFDECHHATKRHPFNLIMRLFYDRCPIEKRPKIFGMTASPVNSLASVESSVSHLEKNLDARVYTASNLEELNITVNKPREITVEYNPPPRYPETLLSQKIRAKIGSIERYKRCFIITSDILSALGPWCCDNMWKTLLTDLERKMSRTTQDLDKDSLIDEDLALKETHEFVDPIIFPRNPNVEDENMFSSKITQLIRVLNVLGSGIKKDFCGIIFVERRHTAVAIKNVISALDSLSFLRCDCLIGHGSTEEGDIQMSFKDQNKVINKFRTGELNLLIATNVAEEGLDIQPCNVVIRFDFFYTLIAYVQSRGRARQKNSTFIMFLERGNVTQNGSLDNFREQEKKLKEYCQTLPEERNVATKFAIGMDLSYGSDDEYDSDDEDFLDGAIFNPETGAALTKQNAIPLLHRYCSNLPSDSFCVLKPVFEIINTGEGFLCKVTLPNNAAIQQVESPLTRTKDHARALAALQACSQLVDLKAFDSHLMPRNIRKEILGEMAPQYDENGLIIGSRRRHGMYEKRTPRLWDRIVEEEEEIAGVEDNEDLLKARAHTVVAEEVVVQEIQKPNGDGQEDKQADKVLVMEEKKELEVAVTVNDESTNGDILNGNAEVPGVFDDLADLMKPIVPKDVTPAIEQLENELSKVNLNEFPPEEELYNENEEETKEEELEEELEEGPFTCWFTIIEVEMKDNKFEGVPYRRLCLISKKPFPDIPAIKLFHKSVPFKVKMRNLATEVVLDRDRILHLSEYMMKLLLALINKEFHCPINDIPYYIVPLVKKCEDLPFESLSANELKNLVDWEEVNSIKEFKSTPFVLNEEKDPTDCVVIDHSDNMRRYCVMNVRGAMSPLSPVPQGVKIREAGYAIFADFYKEKSEEKGFLVLNDENQPLLEVKRLKKVINFLYPGEIVPAQLKGPLMTWAVPEFCQKFFMSASVYQATMMIPSIMTRVDSLLLCEEAKVRYDLPIDDVLMLEAYTTPSASMEMNYERLETLGDSLLKFIATIRLFINFPFENEGQLHHLRIRVICNRAMYRSAKRLKFYRYVTSQAFNRRYWRPPKFTSPADNQETMDGLKYHKLSDKTLADIVEASLGAAYLSNGLEGGLHAAIQLQIPFDEIKTWSDFAPAFEEQRHKVPPRAEVQALRKLTMANLTKIVGREFEKPLLLVEALTHASLPNSTSPCYQRLEFLGDAILDFLVIRYLFSKYPNGDPGLITDLKDSCVNNNVLGIICVETGLWAEIIHYSGKLTKSIEQFVGEVREVKEKGEAVGEYWTDFNIPKVLSDVVESMLGAAFVDAGFRLEPCEELFAKWFLPIFDNHVTPELIKIHPLRRLITDLQRFGCDGFMLRNHTSQETGKDSQKCVIFLHDKPLACGSGWNIKTARRHAATKASQRLEDEPNLLESVCNCRVSMIKRGLLAEEYDEKDAYDED